MPRVKQLTQQVANFFGLFPRRKMTRLSNDLEFTSAYVLSHYLRFRRTGQDVLVSGYD